MKKWLEYESFEYESRLDPSLADRGRHGHKSIGRARPGFEGLRLGRAGVSPRAQNRIGILYRRTNHKDKAARDYISSTIFHNFTNTVDFLWKKLENCSTTAINSKVLKGKVKIFWMYWRRAGSSARAGRAEGSAGQPSVYAGRAQPAPAPNVQGAKVSFYRNRYTTVSITVSAVYLQGHFKLRVEIGENDLCVWRQQRKSPLCPLLHLHLQNCKPRVFTVGISLYINSPL